MRIFVISDLHIGIDSINDIFKWDTDLFINRMNEIIKCRNIDEVILNGDIYELYKYSFSEIESKNKELIKYLKQFKFIKGNHDSTAPYGENHIVYENSKGQKVLIEHGHSCDFLNGTILGRVISRLLFKFLKLSLCFNFVRKIYFKIVNWDDTKILRKYDRLAYLEYALKKLHDYDVVILGHTHKTEYHKSYHETIKKRYFNTGSCTFNKLEGVILDLESMEYEIIKT